MQYGKLYKVHKMYLCRIQKCTTHGHNALTKSMPYDILNLLGLFLACFKNLSLEFVGEAISLPRADSAPTFAEVEIA